MTVVFAILQLMACLAILVAEYNRRSVALFFWGMLCIIFALPHTMDIVIGGYSYSDSTMTLASLFVLLFCFLYAITRRVHLKNPRGFEAGNGALDIFSKEKSNRVGMREYGAVAIALLLVLSVAAFSRANFGSLGNVTWAGIYSAQDGLSSPLFALAPYLFASIGGAIAVLWAKKKWIPFLIMIAACILFLLITRNRIVMLSFVCPLCLLITSRIKRLSFKSILLGLALVVLILYSVYAILTFRHAGTMENFFSSYSLSTFNRDVFASMLSGEGELGLRNIFYYFIEWDNSFAGFSEGATYIRILLFWVPTGLSQGIKPDDFAITMASAYMGNPFNETYSVHPTFFGDAFANFGFIGFLVGIFWGVVMNCIDAWLSRADYANKPYLVSALAYAFVIVGRGSVYNGVMIGIVSVVVIFGASAVLAFFDARKPKTHSGRKSTSMAVGPRKMD